MLSFLFSVIFGTNWKKIIKNKNWKTRGNFKGCLKHFCLISFWTFFVSSGILLLIPLSSDLSLKQIHFCAYLRFSCEYFHLNDLMFHTFLSKMTCMLFSGCSLCRSIYDRLKNVSYVCIGLNHAYFVSQVAVLRQHSWHTEYSTLYNNHPC